MLLSQSELLRNKEHFMQYTGGNKAYNKFVNDKMAEMGIDDLGNLSDAETKKFFNQIDKEWKADDEGETKKDDKYYQEEERESLRNFVMENVLSVDESIWTATGQVVKRAKKPAGKIIKSAKKMRWDSKLKKLVPQMA